MLWVLGVRVQGAGLGFQGGGFPVHGIERGWVLGVQCVGFALKGQDFRA